MIGRTAGHRIVFVSHCQRGNRLRIISARRATRRERRPRPPPARRAWQTQTDRLNHCFLCAVRGWPPQLAVSSDTSCRSLIAMIRACLIAGWMILWQAAAQTIPYAANYHFGGHIPSANGWGGPFALDLVPVAGGRGGKVWLRQTPDGILVFGRITGGRLEYAGFPAEMGSRAYVGIWLAASRGVEMPELGWGNQFGLTNCKGIDNPPRGSLEGCRSWEARQLKYREQLRRVFMRHWKLAPGVSFETDATEAYRNALAFMSDRDRLNFAKLEPRGGPLMEVGDFEIFIRWSDFPPVNLLDISKIYFALDLCEPDHPCASTSPNRKDGDPSTFRELTLERPKVSSISPCGHPPTLSHLKTTSAGTNTIRRACLRSRFGNIIFRSPWAPRWLYADRTCNTTRASGCTLSMRSSRRPSTKTTWKLGTSLTVLTF